MAIMQKNYCNIHKCHKFASIYKDTWVCPICDNESKEINFPEDPKWCYVHNCPKQANYAKREWECPFCNEEEMDVEEPINILHNLSVSEYQVEARKTAIYPNIGDNIVYTALGLCGEAGEIANKVKKIMRDDNNKITPEKKQELFKELGDVLWYLSNTCDELGVTLEEVAKYNLLKLRSRQERNALQGSGDER